MMSRTYSELIRLKTLKERYHYLRLGGMIGEKTFGFDRYLNQYLYKSGRWKSLRNEIIIRDEGCDLGCPDYSIGDRIYIHHMNPITVEDVENDRSIIYEPEFLICTSYNTHSAIHFGDESLLPQTPISRRRNDTCPWKGR